MPMGRTLLPEAVERYVSFDATLETPVQKRLRAETSRLPEAHMQIGPDQGALFALLVRTIGAQRALEIGTFTGYSALAMAEGLPDGGEIVTCDIDPKATAIATKYWSRSPHGKKIVLRLGPALDTIAGLAGPIDLVFIDADKTNYIHYWDACLPKVRAGGVILADNVLWSGEVLAPKEADARALAAFNEHIARDPRVEHVMLPIRDGITIAVKR
jgi:predicted O-methyltransferase YrrM